MPSPPIDLLILGAGWTSTFLIPHLRSKNLSFAATTRDGRPVADAATIKWSFDPTTTTSQTKNQFTPLPAAKHILITFPLTGPGQSTTLVQGYQSAHPDLLPPHFIQLGSTGIWQIPRPDSSSSSSSSTSPCWTTRTSPHDHTSPRAIAEDELLTHHNGCVLNLAGLWDGSTRNPQHWVSRVATSKDAVRGKKSLHLVHGEDVARGIVGVISSEWERSSGGQRWMVTDGCVYDWWMLFVRWADVGTGEGVDRMPSEQARWVGELMGEEGVRALPRSVEVLGRGYDSREFWKTYGLSPLKAGLAGL